MIKGRWQAPSPLASKVHFACSLCPAPLTVLLAKGERTLHAERSLKGVKGGEIEKGEMNCFEISREHDIAMIRA